MMDNRPAVLLAPTVMPGDPLACDSCAVRDRSICSTLSRDEIKQLNAISKFKTFEPGQQVLRDGEQQEFFATVVDGVIKLAKSMGDGRQQIVGLQFPSDFLGRPMRRTSPYDAIAATHVTLCMFSRARFEALARSCPSLEHRLLAHTLDELDAAQDWLLLLGRKTAFEKVATLLRQMAQRHLNGTGQRRSLPGPDGVLSFDLPLTRGEMADFLGLTIETVSRQLTRLKAGGIISLDWGRRISILNFDGLEQTSQP